jgi:hypothetical protein
MWWICSEKVFVKADRCCYTAVKKRKRIAVIGVVE